MNYTDAIAILRDGGSRGQRADALSVVYDEVRFLCRTPTGGDTTLSDWLAEGDWSTGPYDPADIAAEWDALEGTDDV